VFERELATQHMPTAASIIAAHEPLKPSPVTPVDDTALWLWGTLKDFERCGCLARDARSITETMTGPMLADVHRMLPIVMDWLPKLETENA
jgi:hypothetical protein